MANEDNFFYMPDETKPAYGDGLTTRLRQLRDGTDMGSSSHTTTRRQARISTLEIEHGKALEAIAEFDKVRSQFAQLDCHEWMRKHLDAMVVAEAGRVRKHADDIHRSLTQLRSAR